MPLLQNLRHGAADLSAGHADVALFSGQAFLLRRPDVLWLVAILSFAALVAAPFASANDESASAPPLHVARIKDLTTVEGIRDNQLVGYGLVVGLNNTGDKQQTIFSIQTLGNMLQRMGVNIKSQLTNIQVRNIAAVFVTADIPPFSRPGMKLDVTVSSIGDAKSLAGGTLVFTPLSAADGQVYATAQGPLIIGGYSAGTAANSKVVNHPTVGRIPEGALIERDTSVDLTKFKSVNLLLRDADFDAARDIAIAINKDLGAETARAVNSRRVEIPSVPDVQTFMARIGDLTIHLKPPAKVVVNERTGTIVMGGNVTISACSILHGNLSIQVSTEFQVSQPAPLSKNGQTTVVPQTQVQANEGPVQVIQLKEGATVEELIRGLQTLGASARDIVAILQSIKAAGSLNAALEVL